MASLPSAASARLTISVLVSFSGAGCSWLADEFEGMGCCCAADCGTIFLRAMSNSSPQKVVKGSPAFIMVHLDRFVQRTKVDFLSEIVRVAGIIPPRRSLDRRAAILGIVGCAERTHLLPIFPTVELGTR